MKLMRDRLVELLQNFADGTVTGNGTIVDRTKVEDVADFLLANGVIVPPCKVGDTVYRIVKMGTGIHYKQIGRCGIGHTQGYKIVPCEEKIKRFIRSVTVTKNNLFDICENFGKTVFLTKEEAEKALKGGEKE